ncbi:NAD-dependent epimerase/dehydratase family protein [Gracilibacillus phocaeensis]|uniref:NAD-dependent epimerase/dehydratase family protein n=1 Tax=Gracilibacillus phocaeensis TaxID=2042304 RepID=UPI00103031AB|nr:NAD-dependent epimerase/dehydratase family protein [Gracilibacillus phocaeensis]
MINIVVTGATGFLGKRVVRQLYENGYQVTATGRNIAIGEQLKALGIPFHPVDLLHKEQVTAICKGQDLVIHCAALSSSWGRRQDFYQHNVTATHHVVQACIEQQVERLLFVSTPSVYSNGQDQLLVPESQLLPTSYTNHFAATKRQAEEIVTQAFHQGLATITLRPRAIFGPGDPNIMPRIIEANRQGRLPFIDGGQACIDLTYVDNVIQAIMQAIHADAASFGKIYNISNGEQKTLRELVTPFFAKLDQPVRSKEVSYSLAYKLATAMEWKARLLHPKKEPLLTRMTVEMLGRSLTLDITAAQQELHYQPLVSVEEGMDRYVDWYQTQSAR